MRSNSSRGIEIPSSTNSGLHKNHRRTHCCRRKWNGCDAELFGAGLHFVTRIACEKFFVHFQANEM